MEDLFFLEEAVHGLGDVGGVDGVVVRVVAVVALLHQTWPPASSNVLFVNRHSSRDSTVPVSVLDDEFFF